MGEFSHLTRCLELGEREMCAALSSRAACQELLTHLARIAQPKQGAPKIMLLFGRMAGAPCPWLDGRLHVQLVGVGATTVVDLASDLGFAMRERLFPTLTLGAPFEEFTLAVERVPALIAPLIVKTDSARRMALVLRPDADRGPSAAPPAIHEKSIQQ